MTKIRRPHVRDDETCEAAPREEISDNAAGPTSALPDRDTTVSSPARQPRYEQWTREKLYAHARNVGIKRRSFMNKEQLIDALRKAQCPKPAR